MNAFIEINLLPIEDRKLRRDYSYLLDFRLVVPGFVLLGCLAAYSIAGAVLRGALEEKVQELAEIQQDIDENKGILDQIKQLESLLDRKKSKNRSLRSIRLNKQFWVRSLEAFNKFLPDNTWLGSLTQSQDQTGKVEITGYTFVFSEVATFMMELEKSPLFSEVRLTRVALGPAADKGVFTFVLQVVLARDPVREHAPAGVGSAS